jgi:cytochrome P450
MVAMTDAVARELADVEFPVQRGCPFAPPAEYGEIRERGHVSKVRLIGGGEAWWISGHAAGRAVLTDPRFSSDRRKEGFPFPSADTTIRERFRTQPLSMIGMDGAEHSAARRAVLSEFTVRRLNELRPRIQEIVDGFIDEMLAGEERPVDLVTSLSLPVPSMVICEMLGVPYADHDFFQKRTSALIRRTTDPKVRARCFEELNDYLGDLIDRKAADPRDDLFSRQILKQREKDEFDRASLVSMAFLLLVAGHETTANMISLGVVGLLDHPDQLAALKADPTKTAMAVEELLRYFSIVGAGPSRIATEDVEVAGVTVKAGEGVIVSSLSADWDPAVFADPSKLDIDRGARHHIAFGFGPHQCLGQNLARTELQIVFETLFRRVPTLRLATPVDDVPFKSDSGIYGAWELPVTW